MGNEGATAQHPGAVPPVTVQGGRPTLVLVIVRVALVLAWLVIAGNAATGAREASLGDLQRDLVEGRVTAIEVVRAGPDAEGQGRFPVRWDAGLFDSFTLYEYDPSAGVDEAAPLLAQARTAGVPVRVVPVDQYRNEATVTPEGWVVAALGPWVMPVGLLVIVASMIMLITSPRPWFATKWAWFWLVWAIPPLWVAFLALEPRPLRLSAQLAAARLRPRPLLGAGDRRLTGGWALVIAWVASAILAATGLPVLSGWH
ncbi:hypothetical protein [Ruania zhangjianzhongii]|uniref:hypothetical protein n=1 Tax=Ruania zhangjianzhongii TaxID=2603206 RepID=UPI0011CC0289|nr:hypothetical protein [Ruania zhangjianzhongii]